MPPCDLCCFVIDICRVQRAIRETKSTPSKPEAQRYVHTDPPTLYTLCYVQCACYRLFVPTSPEELICRCMFVVGDVCVYYIYHTHTYTIPNTHLHMTHTHTRTHTHAHTHTHICTHTNTHTHTHMHTHQEGQRHRKSNAPQPRPPQAEIAIGQAAVAPVASVWVQALVGEAQ